MPSLKVLLSRCSCNSGGTSVFWKSFQRLSHFLSVHSTRGSGALMDWEGRSGVAQGVHVQEANSKSSLSRNRWSPGFWFKGPGHSYSCSSGGQTKSITEFGHLKLQTAGSLHRMGGKTLPRIWACLVPAFRPPTHTSSTAAKAEQVQRRLSEGPLSFLLSSHWPSGFSRFSPKFFHSSLAKHLGSANWDTLPTHGDSSLCP